MTITKEQCTIMRGWAVFFIALHNFLHLEVFGFAQENETRFCKDGLDAFLDNIANGGGYFENIFSFIGWLGVPIFVFLSGYGLATKYGSENKSIEFKTYIKHSYLKLLSLILPATLIVIPYQFVSASALRALKSVLSLSFLNTLIPSGLFNYSLPSVLPTYWYFSLTFQLYLLYLLFAKVKNQKTLIIVGVTFLLVTMLLGPDIVNDSYLLRYDRLNLIGWIPVFVTGMLMASYPDKDRKCSTLVQFFVVALSLVLMIVMNANYYLWVFIPWMSILFFYTLAVLINKLKCKRVSLWLGTNSMYIFCAHPLVILLFQTLYDKGILHEVPLYLLTVLYIVLFLTIAIVYRIFHRFIKQRLIKT